MTKSNKVQPSAGEATQEEQPSLQDNNSPAVLHDNKESNDTLAHRIAKFESKIAELQTRLYEIPRLYLQALQQADQQTIQILRVEEESSVQVLKKLEYDLLVLRKEETLEKLAAVKSTIPALEKPLPELRRAHQEAETWLNSAEARLNAALSQVQELTKQIDALTLLAAQSKAEIDRSVKNVQFVNEWLLNNSQQAAVLVG